MLPVGNDDIYCGVYVFVSYCATHIIGCNNIFLTKMWKEGKSFSACQEESYYTNVSILRCYMSFDINALAIWWLCYHLTSQNEEIIYDNVVI